jgi:hypothetical protein
MRATLVPAEMLAPGRKRAASLRAKVADRRKKRRDADDSSDISEEDAKPLRNQEYLARRGSGGWLGP